MQVGDVKPVAVRFHPFLDGVPVHMDEAPQVFPFACPGALCRIEDPHVPGGVPPVVFFVLFEIVEAPLFHNGLLGLTEKGRLVTFQLYHIVVAAVDDVGHRFFGRAGHPGTMWPPSP